MHDLHRHDQFSRFDGFGRPLELARLAKELGHTALATSNHGNTNGLVQTYKACQEVGIKAILGVEGYFLPIYKPSERGYHLCLFAKDLKGYENLNRIQYEGEKQKYYNPIWDFDILRENSEGLICTSACVGSYSSQCIAHGKIKTAKKYFKEMVSIFGDDFYIEIQPYKVTEEGLQEKVNEELIKIAKEMNIKCILTSDSHRGRKDELDTYMKMHEMDGHNKMDIEATYGERYMPTEKEIMKRFYRMHRDKSIDGVDFKCKQFAKEMICNLEEIEDKVEDDILGQLELKLPKIADSIDSEKELLRQVKKGLKKRGKYTKEYIERCKHELDVIQANGFVDYFLIVADYTQWAKDHDIAVGPGRGSVCNSLVAYALYITDVDSLLFDLDFRRFMRKDKKAFPDIDLDFETDRRQEVIEYLIAKYEGHAARVASYGLYKVDNTLNELAKVCGLPTEKGIEPSIVKRNKEVLSSMKKLARDYLDDSGNLMECILDTPEALQWNAKYDDIFIHFYKMFNKVRYIGTHSAGVVITSGDILQYTSLRIDKDGNVYASYDLEDLNDINIIKFDLLGLKTMQSLGECRKLTDRHGFDESIVNDKELLAEFAKGHTSGIFQLERNTARGILQEIEVSTFDDVMATSALNRPGPLKQKMHKLYAINKMNIDEAMQSPFYQYAQESYGTIIYQEQLMQLCVNLGGYTWPEADRMLKITKHGKELALRLLEEEKKQGTDYHKKFVTNAVKNGLTKEEAEELFESMLVYSFNKGHAAGYSLISMDEMYYKHYHPVIYWYTKIKYANNDKEKEMYSNKASKDEVVIFLPHVNYSKVATSLRKIDGECALQRGFTDLKGIGEKAAEVIEVERKENGIFRCYDEFYDRCTGRVVNKKVIRLLQENGALDFDKKKYMHKVMLYNSALYGRGNS